MASSAWRHRTAWRHRSGSEKKKKKRKLYLLHSLYYLCYITLPARQPALNLRAKFRYCCELNIIFSRAHRVVAAGGWPVYQRNRSAGAPARRQRKYQGGVMSRPAARRGKSGQKLQSYRRARSSKSNIKYKSLPHGHARHCCCADGRGRSSS